MYDEPLAETPPPHHQPPPSLSAACSRESPENLISCTYTIACCPPTAAILCRSTSVLSRSTLLECKISDIRGLLICVIHVHISRINHSPNKALLSPPLLFLGVEKQQLTCGCFHFLNSQKGLRRPTGQSHETVGFIWRLPSSSCFPLDLQNPLLSI